MNFWGLSQNICNAFTVFNPNNIHFLSNLDMIPGCRCMYKLQQQVRNFWFAAHCGYDHGNSIV